MIQPVHQLGKLFFYAKHPILLDISKFIFEGLSIEKSLKISSRVNIFIGVHQFDKDDFSDYPGINIGLQTEQFFDESGKKLWGAQAFHQVINGLFSLDYLIDFSHSNQRAYVSVPISLIKAKMIYGPYIFPDKEIDHRGPEDGHLVFIGALSERREMLLKKLTNLGIKVKSIQGVGGSEALSLISESEGLVNIHFEDGVYSEWPRVLMAYLSGRILFSETLSADLVAGRHYIKIDSVDDFLKKDSSEMATIYENIFKSLREDIVKNYIFEDIIHSIVNKAQLTHSNHANTLFKNKILKPILRLKLKKFGIN
jgi:hypothetical protein